MVTTPTTFVDGQVVTAVLLNKGSTAITELQGATGASIAEMELNLGTSPSPATNAWFKIVTWNATAAYSTGLGLTAAATGITVANTGRYQVSGSIYWATNATGTRYGGLGQAALAAPPLTVQDSKSATGGGAIGHVLSAPLSLVAADVITMWGYQTSGAALQISAARLVVRQLA